MTRIGIIGTGKYVNKDFLLETLEQVIDKDKDIIVSGHSPRNKYDNPDMWGEIWGNDNCKNEPDIYPPKSFTTEYFFMRNKEIAENSDVLLVFMNKGRHKSGAWNAVKYFVAKEDFEPHNLLVYDEYGFQWREDEYPLWLLNKIRKEHFED